MSGGTDGDGDGAAGYAPSEGSSSDDGGLFGSLSGMMEEAEEEGAVEVAQVQRKDSGDVDRSGHENWVFKTKSYWDERFSAEDDYDWLTGFGGIEALLRKHITPSDRILIVGCGNSTLSREMFDSGFIQLTNLDFSATVIERMAARHADCGPTMRWVVGDMMDMHTLDDGSFDVVLDKAAMDALLVDEGDVWNPREACLRDADRALSEFSRVLRPGGQLLQITFAQPHFRRRYLDKPKYGWRLLPHETVQEGLGYFFYVVLKHGGGVGSSSSALPVGGAAVAVEVPAEEGKGGGAGSPAPAPESLSEFVAGVCKDQSTAAAVPGRAGADGIAQPHPPRCECGCIPAGIPSLFEMAALRKAHAARKAREGASERVSE